MTQLARLRWLLASLCGTCVLLGCGQSASAPVAQNSPRGLGSAAASVNGQTIALAEVHRLSAATGLAPEAALERLVAERLLVQYAQSRGYAAAASVRRGTAQAGVHALLAQAIEGEGHSPDVAERQHELSRLLDELAARTPIRYDEAAIRAAFAR